MLAGYELKEVLAGDELYTLRRGVAAVDGAAVLIKTPTRAVPGSAEIACLRREFVLLQSLQIGAVARARALAHDGRSVALVYEGFAGVPLAALVEAKAGDVAFVLQVALQLATVLESLHGRGIAHNALNPSAILVDAASGGVQLVDFSAAAEEAAVVHGGLPQQPLRSRLAYASPEQTARTTRVADYRSDFYSLGVVMYQLLTGLLPFKSDDPLELIHWHIAKIPAAPCELQPRVPRPVSEIAMKLLAKTPEERYQSAAGLRADLERCAREWAHQGRIAPFAIARNDLSERFVVPQQLYGREQELETLIAAFEHSCDGPPVMALVAGYAGIGKTALIGELSGPIARRRGYFVTGKFDQVTRDVPHQALIQALRQLVQRLLTEDAARMERWRLRLSRALGDNAGVVAAVLPEIEGVIGETAPPLPLPPTEARNRFASAFQNLIAALASAEQPLAILLDDLQWADAATLSLLHPLLERLDVPGLMLIGAYRDNEVDAEHPLTRAIAELDQAGVALCRIALGPLGTPDLVQMIAQCLHCDPAAAEPLAAVLQSKTAGNPFFVIQFLKTLHQERLIQFSPQARCWSYRLEAVRRADITDNVIDLMARKIGRLSPRTQHVLRRAACVGNRFDLATLATVSEQSAEALAADLTEALSQGLVLPARGERSGDRSGAAFAFLHDRVQQAAYGQIPAEQRPRVHLSVGRLLLRRWRQLPGEESVFDIVGHLNAGSALITEDAERIELARLNLEAAHEAKSATAFETALGYAEAGAGLLREAHWSSEYELAFSLALETAECEYLCGRFDAAERHFDALLERARTPLDQAKVYSLRLLQYESLSRYVEAIRVGHEALQRLGLSVPGTREQREAALAVEVAAIREWVSGRDLAGLAASRSMQDPALRMVMRLLTNLHTSCYLSGDKTLTMLNTAYMVRRSLEHGNTEESAYAYVLYAAMLLVPSERDYLTAHAFGELALRVNDRLPAPAIRAKVLMNIGWAISLWRRPMAESIAISREAHRLGNDNGMLVEAAYALFNECWLMLLSGGDLDAFHQACAPSVDYARRVKMRHYAAAPQLILQWGLALQGLTREPVSLSDAGFDEEAFVQAYRGQPLFEMFYFVAKLALLYTFERYGEALQAARRAEAIIQDFPGTIWDQQTAYYRALTLCALYPQLTSEERAQALTEVAGIEQRLQLWAQNCPQNFRHHQLLVCAEVARARGEDTGAIGLYEKAIAAPAQCPRESALANELYARFWLDRGNDKIARLYRREACAQYRAWGAAAKARSLEQRYGLQPDEDGAMAAAGREADSAERPLAETLDLATIFKAARAISAEVVLEDFLKRMLGIAIENAGARRGLLIEEREGELTVTALARVDPQAFSLLDASVLRGGVCSSAVVNYVRRTGSSLVLVDASRDPRFAADDYIAARGLKSVLCMPIVHQATFSAMLYLENELVAGAFTPERIDLLGLLSAQAAISLENARLFERMKREIEQRQAAEQALREALFEVETLKNRLEEENVYLRRDLVANVSHDLRTPLAALRGYLETLALKEASLTPDKRRAYLDIALRQSQRLGLLIAQLFELAKLDIQDVEVHLETVQLGELVQDVVQKFQLQAQEQGVTLRAEIARAAAPVRVDISLMERVLDNLIQNALQHLPASGEVCAALLAGSEDVTVQVRDNGSGIAPEDLPHIFERFHRGDKSRSPRSGAGLGLAIVKRILDLHGVGIRVESRPLAGACFSFTLPACVPQAVLR